MTDRVLRVLIADDHPVFRSGLCALLEGEGGFVVVGQASTGAEAVALAIETAPDIVLMDLHMPDLDGVRATQLLTRDVPGAAVLVVTMFEDDDSVFAAMHAGARGYVLKGADQAALLETIRAVGAGSAVFGPGVAERVSRFFRRGPTGPVPFPELSDREREILGLVAEGHKNSAIARRLVISEKTVRNHISNIFTKLGVLDRSQAIVRARDAGLGHPS